MASFVLCPHRPPQGERGPRRLRGTDGRTDGRTERRTPKSSLRRDINVGGDAASAFVSIVIKRTRNCLLWKAGARVQRQRRRQRAQSRRLLLFQAWHAWRHCRRRGGRGGATGKDQNVFVWSQYPRGLEKCRRRKGKRRKESRASYCRQKVYIRIDFSIKAIR